MMPTDFQGQNREKEYGQICWRGDKRVNLATDKQGAKCKNFKQNLPEKRNCFNRRDGRTGENRQNRGETNLF